MLDVEGQMCLLYIQNITFFMNNQFHSRNSDQDFNHYTISTMCKEMALSVIIMLLVLINLTAAIYVLIVQRPRPKK